MKFGASIKIDANRTVKFSRPVKYLAPSGIEVILENHDKDIDALLVNFICGADSIEIAQSLVEGELMRLANMLAWKRQLRILGARINCYEYSEKKNQQNAVVFVDTIHLVDHLSISPTLNENGVNLLSKALAEEVGDQFLDVITLWRDALREVSDLTRYFLLYRILEDLAGNRKNVDNWILSQNPTIEQRTSKDDIVTIYTYLRDNIHPKKENRRFPFSEVSAHVNGLQELAKKLITQKFPEAADV